MSISKSVIDVIKNDPSLKQLNFQVTIVNYNNYLILLSLQPDIVYSVYCIQKVNNINEIQGVPKNMGI